LGYPDRYRQADGKIRDIADDNVHLLPPFRTRHDDLNVFNFDVTPGKSCCQDKSEHVQIPPEAGNTHVLFHHDGEPSVKLVAVCNLLEAITYLRKWHPDLDILRVEFVALIEIVSGSPRATLTWVARAE
jgi:hypothetical protein